MDCWVVEETDEGLALRWYQAGFLFPFLRNHANKVSVVRFSSHFLGSAERNRTFDSSAVSFIVLPLFCACRARKRRGLRSLDL